MGGPWYGQYIIREKTENFERERAPTFFTLVLASSPGRA